MSRFWCLAIIFAGCSGAPADNDKPAANKPVFVNKAEDTAAPTTEHEKLVAKYIIGHANQPKSVAFAKWGPNLDVSKKEKPKNLDPVTEKVEMFVRVAYRATNEAGATQFYDQLFMVSAKHEMVILMGPTQGGDNWLAGHEK